jgi:hypothetical protein
MKKLVISKNLGLDNKKLSILQDFCKYCIAFLDITSPVKIYVVDSRELHGIKTTAYYDRSNSIIKIYGKNRALVDICRSICHELVHCSQDEQGLLVGVIQDAGGEIEDEANARAGEVIKRFAKSSEGRKSIYESLLVKSS